MLTAAEIKARVNDVMAAVSARDHDLAHALEDELWHDTLEAIAAGAFDAQDLATAALATASLKFPRWTA